MTAHLTRLLLWLDDAATRLTVEEDGFSTAELLGNAALGIAALVAIWAALRAVGIDVVNQISSQLLNGGG